MIFHDPLALALLLPLALLLVIRRMRPGPAIPFPAVADLFGLPKSLRQRSAWMLPWMRGAALTIAVVALARPQIVNTETEVVSKGVDIVLALDLSTSMLAVDRRGGKPGLSRHVIAREVAREFVGRRPGDRIGFVAFAARPYPAAPLTLDHDWLAAALERFEPGSMEDGTALGDGLLAAVNRLRASPAGSRTVVLITDGRSNGGAVLPLSAAAAARALGIRVHTIGIGSTGVAEFPVEDPRGGVVWRRVAADLDEATLQDVAAITGGRFFRADGADTLRQVFREIDRLERHTITETKSRGVRELFPPLLLAALLLMAAEHILRFTGLRSLP